MLNSSSRDNTERGWLGLAPSRSDSHQARNETETSSSTIYVVLNIASEAVPEQRIGLKVKRRPALKWGGEGRPSSTARLPPAWRGGVQC